VVEALRSREESSSSESRLSREASRCPSEEQQHGLGIFPAPALFER
jgi:hypothetical protein